MYSLILIIHNGPNHKFLLAIGKFCGDSSNKYTFRSRPTVLGNTAVTHQQRTGLAQDTLMYPESVLPCWLLLRFVVLPPSLLSFLSDPSRPWALLIWLVPDLPLSSSCRLNIPQLKTTHTHTKTLLDSPPPPPFPLYLRPTPEAKKRKRKKIVSFFFFFLHHKPQTAPKHSFRQEDSNALKGKREERGKKRFLEQKHRRIRSLCCVIVKS